MGGPSMTMQCGVGEIENLAVLIRKEGHLAVHESACFFANGLSVWVILIEHNF